MGFRQADSEGRGGYARIWSVENKGKYSVAKVSTSRKRRDDDGYETDFQDGFVRLIGSAHDKMKDVEVPDKGIGIQITSCEATCNYDKTKKTTYHNYMIYAFEFTDSQNNFDSAKKKKTPAKPSGKSKKVEADDESDEDLPF